MLLIDTLLTSKIENIIFKSYNSFSFTFMNKDLRQIIGLVFGYKNIQDTYLKKKYDNYMHKNENLVGIAKDLQTYKGYMDKLNYPHLNYDYKDTVPKNDLYLVYKFEINTFGSGYDCIIRYTHHVVHIDDNYNVYLGSIDFEDYDLRIGKIRDIDLDMDRKHPVDLIDFLYENLNCIQPVANYFGVEQLIRKIKSME